MREVLIVDGVRTPVGRIGGALRDLRPDDMAGMVLAEALRRSGAEGSDVDEVFMGCANQAGEDNRNVARMGLLLGGLPQSVPGVTVNRLCASGLEAVAQAARMIKVGEAELCLAGGVESMSRAPWVLPKSDRAFPVGSVTAFDTSLGWRFPNPKMEALFPLEAMGETAENLQELYGIGRERQDAFALRSHQLALAAWDAGHYARDVMAVELPQKKGPAVVVQRDEGPRAESSLEALAALKPAFRKGGTVTAGNSSTLNDGAAALVLCSEARAVAIGREPRARLQGAASAGVDPRTMGIGPVPAVQKLLARHGLSVKDVDLWELNEAFAVQALSVVDELKIDESKVNVMGGAIAIGHPLGCSGARILLTLVSALERLGLKRGVAALCVGVGQGLAVLVER